MITLQPVIKALFPVDSSAAKRISGPNYDEFQSDYDVFRNIQSNKDSVLRVTMAHCDVLSSENILPDGSSEALSKACENMKALEESELTRVASNVLCIYEIFYKKKPHMRQIGLVGMAKTGEIRTDRTPNGSIIRNEGIRQNKVSGRAALIKETDAYIGIVNNAVEDKSGKITEALELYADSRVCDYSVTDNEGNIHKIWLINEENSINRFVNLFQDEPCAYVADGNHRSAAAAMLNKENFLSVFFTINRMGIAPYNRLVRKSNIGLEKLLERISASFDVERLDGCAAFQPDKIHEIGFYCNKTWYKLKPLEFSYNSESAIESIDTEIVRTKITRDIMNIPDKEIQYVGGNKDTEYLMQKVNDGDFEYAFSLPAVTIEQFLAICQQNLFLPMKSTWFEPKIRSGLVMALLG